MLCLSSNSLLHAAGITARMANFTRKPSKFTDIAGDLPTDSVVLLFWKPDDSEWKQLQTLLFLSHRWLDEGIWLLL